MMVSALMLALAPAAQQSPSPSPSRLEDVPKPWSELPGSADDPESRSKQGNTPGGLRAVQQFGACVADASTAKARKTLAGDFRTSDYRLALKQLADANRSCPSFRGYSRLQSSGLLFAGAIAERLVERDGLAVNIQLAKAATGPAVETYSPTDRASVCVVRSVPDEVAKLFESDVATPAEKTAADALKPVMAACMQGQRVDVTDDGLRAMLATAAFRSIHAAPTVATSN